MTAILGISAFYHDSAAALIIDGEVVAAAQEERFSRIKHDSAFPQRAIEFCLQFAGVKVDELDHVAFYEKPFLKFERILETHLAHAPHSAAMFCKAMPGWLKSKLYLSRVIRRSLGWEGRIVFPSHHESHASSAFFSSPFSEAAILTVDGVGEWDTTTIGVGDGNRIAMKRRLSFPDSLGLLYSTFTAFCGFRVNGGEGKLMGLAPYGKPVFAEKILGHLIDLKSDGSFRLASEYFAYNYREKMFSTRFEQLFGRPVCSGDEMTSREQDLAASIQHVTEQILIRLAEEAYRQSNSKNLCIAGGVGLNCVGNGVLQRESPFEQVWVQPAAGDAGSAIGAAQFVWYQLLNKRRTPKEFRAGLGTVVPTNIPGELKELGVTDCASLADDEVTLQTAQLLAEGKTVGWFQGRSEFGPRALGNRSILASPSKNGMRDHLNQSIKRREMFRPFAPVVLAKRCAHWFKLEHESPFMLFAGQVIEEQRSRIKEVVHVDGSARIQTVTSEQNHRLFQLIHAFEKLTGCPVLLNTSFNLRGQPIVDNVQDAVQCFLDSGLDALVIGNVILLREGLPDDVQLKPLGIQGGSAEGRRGWLSRVKQFIEYVTFPLRWLLTNAVLVVIYFGLLFPMSLIWRTKSRTSFLPVDQHCDSYWTDVEPAELENASYFRQY